MGKYSYSFARGWSSVDSLREARAAVRRILKSDKGTCMLYRDIVGYYIKRYNIESGRTKIFRL